MTAPPGDLPGPDRGRRPAAIELAAALLIVTGVIQLIAAIGVVGSLPVGFEGLLALSIAFDVASIVAGLLVRAGRLWLLVVNYVAVLGFLDLLRIATSPIAIALAAVDFVVLYVLITNRSWFQRPTADEPPDSPELSD